MGLAAVRERVKKVQDANKFDSEMTSIIAVSKMQNISRITNVLDEGHRCFGENRVQEASNKWPALFKIYDGIELHLIGPLQTNKARQAMSLFQAIHSVDRPKLSNTIARLAQETGNCPDIFIQINTGYEPQKAGILPSDADPFIKECRSLDLPLKGLMCIPPEQEAPAKHFKLLVTIAEANGLSGLSMGMSGDFETAVAFGATYVRIGSAIFGSRLPEEAQ
ncbi:MAG: YggS family pyridoxal phosphate-dependent enzyme [Rhodobacteraceae bacterium]|nr:YggS family pyridoxal phosphate-dependent enzyme [Paracoccaceae bacterium]